MKIKVNVDLKIGKLVRNFVMIDLMLFGGWGLIVPVFPVFILDRIQGATLTTIGTAAAIYWIIKSLLQLPIANYIDRNQKRHDDFFIMVAGLLLASFSAFAFILVRNIWELYLIQALHGVAFSLYTPSWSGIFSRHLDKDRPSFDWSLDSTTIGLSAGITGFFGSIGAERFGFDPVFITAAAFSMVSVLILILSPSVIFPRSTTAEPVIQPPHKP